MSTGRVSITIPFSKENFETMQYKSTVYRIGKRISDNKFREGMFEFSFDEDMCTLTITSDEYFQFSKQERIPMEEDELLEYEESLFNDNNERTLVERVDVEQTPGRLSIIASGGEKRYESVYDKKRWILRYIIQNW